MNVLVLVPSAKRYREHLRPRFPEVSFLPAETEEEAEPYLGEAQVLVTIGQHLTRETIGRMPKLAWVQSTITGVDNLLRVLEGREDVLLTSGRGIHGPQMAEMAILHMLCLNRPVRRMMRNQDRHVWERPEQRVLDGKTVGIVGVGVIGEAVARVCKAFGMTVYGISRTARPVEGIDRFFDRSELARAAAEVDFLVLTVPLSPETERLVGAGVLAAMKPTAYLINLARGGVVDEQALIEALRAGTIAGAGLDVFEQPELPPDSPLWELENVFITPWVAGFSDRYVEQVLTVIEPNLRHYLAGERDKLINVVER